MSSKKRPSYRYQGEPPRDLLVPFDVLEPMLPCRSGICTMKKPSKTAAELEASIKVEMEDICDWPTDIMILVQPDGDRRLCKKDQKLTPIDVK